MYRIYVIVVSWLYHCVVEAIYYCLMLPGIYIRVVLRKKPPPAETQVERGNRFAERGRYDSKGRRYVSGIALVSFTLAFISVYDEPAMRELSKLYLMADHPAVRPIALRQARRIRRNRMFLLKHNYGGAEWQPRWKQWIRAMDEVIEQLERSK